MGITWLILIEEKIVSEGATHSGFYITNKDKVVLVKNLSVKVCISG